MVGGFGDEALAAEAFEGFGYPFGLWVLVVLLYAVDLGMRGWATNILIDSSNI